MPRLFSIRAGQVTESGLYASVHPLDAPLWAEGENILFRDGGPCKVPGWVTVTTVPGAGVIRGMDALQDEAAVQRLFLGDATKLWMWNGSTVTQIGSGFTGQVNETVTAPATAWSFARFGNWMLASNGRNPVQIWKGSGSAAALAGTRFNRAEIVMNVRSHLLALNTANGGSWVEWSDADNPEIWTPSSSNAAGDLNIRDMNGPIQAAVRLGENVAVYSKNQMFVLSYAGDPFIFTYQPALTGIGAVGKMAVVEANRRNYGMGRDGFWETDGVSYRYLDTLALRDHWRSRVDMGSLSKVVATYDPGMETVTWFLPTAGTKENSFGVVYHLNNGAWSVLNYGRCAAVSQMGIYRQPVMASAEGGIQFHNEGTNAHLSTLTAFVRTKPLDFDGPERDVADRIKYLDKVLVQARRLAGTVELRVGTRMHLDDAVSWGGYQPLDAGMRPIHARAAGRYVTLEVRAAGPGSDFALSGFDIHGEIGGTV